MPLAVIVKWNQIALTTSEDQEKEEANTIRRVKYTDDEGKERTREEFLKSYKYQVVTKKREMTCEGSYRIVDTRTRTIIVQRSLREMDEDSVEYVNWNNFD